MEKIQINRVSKIAIEESMRNLSEYVNSLDTKTDISLYIHFEAIINALFKDQINNQNVFFKGAKNHKKNHSFPKYKLENNELKSYSKG